MLEPIASPENVLAFRAVGKIEKADYDDVLEPAVEAPTRSGSGTRAACSDGWCPAT
jgi:hypothetical protein